MDTYISRAFEDLTKLIEDAWDIGLVGTDRYNLLKKELKEIKKQLGEKSSSTDGWGWDDEPRPGTIGYAAQERHRGGEDMGW